jgi:hypothetical protein
MQKKNQPGRHHFIPEFFIKRFSEHDKEFVFVYEKLYDKLGTIPQAAGTICYQQHLYSLGSASQRFPILEQAFSMFETKWSELFKILDGDLASANKLLSDQNAENALRFFYACQFWRTPKRRELAIESADELLMRYDQMDRATYLLVPIERKELKRVVKLRKSRDSANIIQNFLFPLMTYMTPFMEGARFWVVEKPLSYSPDLICSDVGVVGDKIEEVFAAERVTIFPLSRRRLLVLARGSEEIDAASIETFQSKLFDSAFRYVFCASRAGLETRLQRAKQGESP